jgi:hypothetical protein
MLALNLAITPIFYNWSRNRETVPNAVATGILPGFKKLEVKMTLKLRTVLMALSCLVCCPCAGLAIEPGEIDCSAIDTFCASSCDLDDVQAAADDAMASGLADTTIYIPACSPDPYNWPESEKLVLNTDANKTLRLIGSGVLTTRIVHFQIDVPSSGKLNLVELGHISCDGNEAVTSMLDYRIRPETLNTELFWHDFEVIGYTGNYTLHFEGWQGVVSNLSMTCQDNPDGQNPYGIAVHGDGGYSDHSLDFGTRNAFFIEDSTLVGCSHSVSAFCDAFVVFRDNTVRNADSHTDLHGPGYNYCYYNPDENTAGGGMELYDNQFLESQGNWIINARAGQGHIYTNNWFDSEDYQIVLYWDNGAVTNGNNCGTGPGQTCDRCDTIDCEGCCQAQEKTYIWDNDGSVIEYASGSAGDCLIEDTTYFLRAPTLAEDGFTFTRFTYPHPLAAGSVDTGDDTGDGTGDDTGDSTGDIDEDGDGGTDGSSSGCFINSLWSALRLNGTGG